MQAARRLKDDHRVVAGKQARFLGRQEIPVHEPGGKIISRAEHESQRESGVTSLLQAGTRLTRCFTICGRSASVKSGLRSRTRGATCNAKSNGPMTAPSCSFNRAKVRPPNHLKRHECRRLLTGVALRQQARAHPVEDRRHRVFDPLREPVLHHVVRLVA